MTKHHPEAQELALYVSRDLSAWRRVVVGRHVAGCSVCRHEVVLLREAGRAFAEEVEALPGGMSWERLAADMRANIRLGLEAGECVGDSPSSSAADAAVIEEGRPASWYSGWNPAAWWNSSRLGDLVQVEASAGLWAATGAAAVVLFAAGIFWWQRGEAAAGAEQLAAASYPAAAAASEAKQDGEVVFRTVSDGIVVERAGRSLTLAHGGRSATALTVSLNGSMNAKYVDDDDTGQVTIHHVYAE